MSEAMNEAAFATEIDVDVQPGAMLITKIMNMLICRAVRERVTCLKSSSIQKKIVSHE